MSVPGSALTSLRVAALIAVILLAVVGCLFVFGLIGGEVAAEILIRTLAVVGIVMVAGVATVFLVRSGKKS